MPPSMSAPTQDADGHVGVDKALGQGPEAYTEKGQANGSAQESSSKRLKHSGMPPNKHPSAYGRGPSGKDAALLSQRLG